MPITAIKNGITRTFKEDQWNNLPKDKFGWVQTDGAITATKSAKIPEELIQKKMVAGATANDVKPAEIVKTSPDVPEELLSKPVKKVVPKPTKKEK